MLFVKSLLLTLKIKTASSFTSKRWIYSRMKENYSLGQTHCHKTIGKSEEQRRGIFLRRKEVSWEGCYELKVF